MPKRDQLLSELSAENDVGVFLMVQMDGVPETLQLMIATTQLDEQVGGLRDRGQYVIRAVGVQEHRVAVGLFGSLQFLEAHPLLEQYNTAPVGVFFKGQPDDVNDLLLDIMQAYSSTFGLWRTFPQYMNIAQPLVDLLGSGGGFLGQMPKPLAERVAKALDHHSMEHKLVEEEAPGEDEHGRSQLYKLLVIDSSYVIALDFTVDELGKV